MSEPRDLVKVIDELFKCCAARREESGDDEALVRRIDAFVADMKVIREAAEYAPPEGQSHYWMRGAHVMYSHFPSHEVIAGGAGPAPLTAAVHSRVMMCIWNPKAFEPGGPWY